MLAGAGGDERAAILDRFDAMLQIPSSDGVEDVRSPRLSLACPCGTTLDTSSAFADVMHGRWVICAWQLIANDPERFEDNE